VSIEDLFMVGVGCDLVGGLFLARGLLISPVEVVDRAERFAGGNPVAMAGQIKSKADGEFGIVTLAVGFLLQAGAPFSLCY
jgi:hypothetical protein